MFSLSDLVSGQEELWLHSLNSSDGLVGEYPQHVFQDSEGFVWIGTMSGLNRFDGRTVKNYYSEQGNEKSLLEENILGRFIEDTDNNIWFGTTNAIHRYNRKSDDFSRFEISDAVGLKSTYRVLAMEQDSLLWVSVEDGVWKYNIFNGRYKNVISDTVFLRYFPSMENGVVTSVVGVYSWSDDGFCIYKIKDGALVNANRQLQGQTNIYDILFDGDSVVWMGAETGLFKLDIKRDKLDLFDDFPGHSHYLSKYNEEKIIVSINKSGLYYFYRTGCFEKIDTRIAGPSSDVMIPNIVGCYIDPAKNIWLNTEGNPSGVFYANFGKNKFRYLPVKKYHRDKKLNVFHYLLEDDIGNIWSGSFQNGLVVMDEKGKVISDFGRSGNLKSVGKNTTITNMVKDEEGGIWLSTYDGIKYYDDEKNDFINISVNGVQKKEEQFISIFHAPSNHTILASHINKGGLYALEKKDRGGAMEKLKGFDESTFYLLYENSRKELMASVDDDKILVFKVSDQVVQPLDTVFLKGIVNGFYEDESKEQVWVATSLGPLLVDMNNYKAPPVFLEVFKELPDKNIKAVLPGSRNNLFFSTNSGISEYNIGTGELFNFNLSDGIFSESFIAYGGLKLKNNELWFAGVNGITIVPDQKIKKIKYKPKPKITNIKINDVERTGFRCSLSGATNVSEIKYLKLEPEENTVSFEFVAIEYSDPKNNQLKFFLQGVDKDTVLIKKGEAGFARYPNLPHGTYSFHLQGANSDGVWGDAVEQLTITILPRWYEKTWVRILMLMAAIGLIYLIVRNRINRIKEKETMNTRISENKMEALRSQMNPHFVFNSLQTVNGLIARKDLRGAIQYVNKFAKLMRMILENSRVGMISLEKEIELLELYMLIEAKRFSVPFEYKINVGNELDTFDTQVPSMILQPFVENAIKHGLFHKKEKGLITIGFYRENGHLKCYVEDNGIGRQKSIKVNEQDGREHVSRGLQIVDERFELIRKSHPGDYHVRIIDLYDTDHSSTGTRVEIKLPTAGN